MDEKAPTGGRDRPVYSLMGTGTPDDIARAYYRRIYGAEPERVIQTAGGTLVGPLPEAVANARSQGAGR